MVTCVDDGLIIDEANPVFHKAKQALVLLVYLRSMTEVAFKPTAALLSCDSRNFDSSTTPAPRNHHLLITPP